MKKNTSLGGLVKVQFINVNGIFPGFFGDPKKKEKFLFTKYEIFLVDINNLDAFFSTNN